MRGTKTGLLTHALNLGQGHLFNGRRFWALTVVDNFSRECLAIHAGKSLKGEDVVGVMERLRVLGKRLPVRIQTDNGSLRDECLNIHWFLSLEDAQDKLDNWRRENNHERTHSSLNDMTPAEFIRSLQKDEDL